MVLNLKNEEEVNFVTIKHLKTSTVNDRGGYAKKSMRIFFIFFWLILGYSLVIAACGGANEEPPDDTMQSMSPQQIMIASTTPDTDSIAVTWALEAGSTGEAVVGVVAVLQEAALTPEGACENVPTDVAAHARDGSGEASGRSGSTTYMASNSDSGTLTFGSLAASTMYSIAVCSVSAMKIRGDGTGGTAHSAVVTSVTTDALPTFLKQVTVPQPTFTSGSPPTITVTWSVDTASLGADVQGVVAALKPQTSATEASLNQTNACENVPMAISDHTRGASTSNPSMPMSSGGITYIADNRDGASEVMFTFPVPAAEDTTYSLAVCSVSAEYIRGDGNSDGDNAHAVVYGGIGVTRELPVKQIEVTTTNTANTITVNWAVSAAAVDSHQDVQGVVAALREVGGTTVALNPSTACSLTDGDGGATAVSRVTSHARTGTGTASSSGGELGAMVMAQNNADGDGDSDPDNMGSLTFTGLRPTTTYSIVVCAVSMFNIRGDGNDVLMDDDAVLVDPSVTTSMFTFPKQVTVPMPTFTPGSPPTITITWSVDTTSLGADVQGVVAVLKPQTSATEVSLNQTNACENVPMAISDHARGSDSPNPSMPMTDDGVAYIADNRDGASQVMFSFPFNLTEDTTYSLAVCSVAAGSIRGDGNSDADDAHAVVYSGIGVTSQLPVKQIEVTTTTTTANTITVNWAVSSSAVDSHQDVQGVVTLSRVQPGATIPVDPTDECRPSFCLSDVISYARDGMTGSSSATRFSTTCTAGHDSDNNGMGSLTLTGLRASTTYAIVVCAVSANNIRGDNNPALPDDDAILISPSVTTSMPTFPKQVTVTQPTSTPASNFIAFTWSVDTGSSGAPVQGMVAALRKLIIGSPALNQTNACGNVPMTILDHARGASTINPSDTPTIGGITYIADNRDGASEVMFEFPVPETEGTTYSLAVCSVAAGSIRGDGNSDADDAHAVVYSGIGVTSQFPVKQIEVTTTNTASTITLNWAVSGSAVDSHEDVQGVVTLLRAQPGATTSLDPIGECRTSCTNDVIRYARDGMTGSSSQTSSSTTCTADHDSDNNGMGSLTFTGLRASTTYAIVVCAVSANNIRGDNNPALPDDDAILVSPSPSTAAAP